MQKNNKKYNKGNDKKEKQKKGRKDMQSKKSIKRENSKKENLKVKAHSGITLIALVITIIVLLILAGVALSTLTGDSGILNNAESAKVKTNLANAKEQVELAVQGAKLENVSETGEMTITYANLKKELDKIVGNGKYEIDPEGEADSWTVTVGEYETLVLKNETITVSNAKWEWTDNQEEGTEGHGEISVGDLITYKEKTTEQFYVIKVTGDNVAMLAAKNITTTGTLEQSASAPTVAFSNTNYWSSETSFPVDLNEYTADKTDDEKTSMGVVSTDAIEIARSYGDTFDVRGRLMTVEEVENLEGSKSDYSTSDCPSFINMQNFWLGSGDTSNYVWIVNGENGDLYYGDYVYDDGYYGVRPVIEVLTSSIK